MDKIINFEKYYRFYKLLDTLDSDYLMGIIAWNKVYCNNCKKESIGVDENEDVL